LDDLSNLRENNRVWAARMTRRDPEFFRRLAAQQAPDYLWIGCSDSRVPANEIVDLLPGELFVHRNVANVVVHSDMNCLSVLQFAVESLGVKHIIVCGHYGCGGVQAALEVRPHGLIDNWLRHIRDVYFREREELDAISNPAEKVDRLCELNVIDQVLNVARTTVVLDAWRRGQFLAVHGWVYGLADGLVKDLDVTVRSRNDLENRLGQASA
jgi:carbonic anhydrase